MEVLNRLPTVESGCPSSELHNRESPKNLRGSISSSLLEMLEDLISATMRKMNWVKVMRRRQETTYLVYNIY